MPMALSEYKSNGIPERRELLAQDQPLGVGPAIVSIPDWDPRAQVEIHPESDRLRASEVDAGALVLHPSRGRPAFPASFGIDRCRRRSSDFHDADPPAGVSRIAAFRFGGGMSIRELPTDRAQRNMCPWTGGRAVMNTPWNRIRWARGGGTSEKSPTLPAAPSSGPAPPGSVCSVTTQHDSSAWSGRPPWHRV
jgi:hypothetical protein